MKKFQLKRNRRFIFLLSSIMVLIATVFTVSLLCGGAGYLEAISLGSGGCCYASMAVVGNIGRVGDKETSGKQIAAKVWLTSLDQLNANLPFPVPNANFELGQIPLKQGEYMHYFEAVDDSLEDKSSGSKGDVTTNVTNTFTFIMGGNRIALQRFMEDHPGDRFIVIYQMASDRQYYVLGNDIKPMILKSFERSNGKDNRSVTLTFENASFEQPKKYVGNIIQENPAVLPPNAVSIAFSHKAQYTTGANSSISNISKDGIISNSGSNALYNYMIYLSNLTIPEEVVCHDINFALKLNFPNEYRAGIRIGFYRSAIARQQEVSPQDRPINNAE